MVSAILLGLLLIDSHTKLCKVTQEAKISG